VYDSKDFCSYVKHQFETIELYLPIGVENFLKVRFGDYMKLPSRDEIAHEQHAIECDINRPYKPRKRGLLSDEKYLY
jgi:hypothetical protein